MTVIRLRRGTDVEWAASNPILGDGEAGFERNTGRHKIGDGVTHWLDLDYISPEPVLDTRYYLKTPTTPEIPTSNIIGLDAQLDALSSGVSGGNTGLVTQDMLDTASADANTYTDNAVADLRDQLLLAFGRLPAPVVTVGNVTTTSVQLTWTPVTGATGYQVMRNGVQVGGNITSGVTFTNNTLTPNTSYEYTVHAYNANGNGLDSEKQVVLTDTAAVPTQPTLRSTARTDVSVALAWDAVAGATGYRLYLDGVQQGSDLSAATLTANITGLTAGTSYSFSLKAFNADGESAASVLTAVTTSNVPNIRGAFASPANSAVVATISATLPTGIQDGDDGWLMVSHHNSGLTLDSPPAGWTLDDTNVVGTSILGWLYKKELTAADSGGTVSVTFSGPTRPHIVGYVVARGSGVADKVKIVDNTQDAVMDLPALTTLVSDTRLIGLLTTRFAATTGDVITLPAAYTKSVEVIDTLGTTPQMTATAFTKPLPGAAQTVAADTTGTYSSNAFEMGWLLAVAKDLGLPAAVENLHTTSVTTTQAVLVWDAVTGATGYKVTKNGVELAATPTATTYTDSGNTPGSSNTYAVRAINANGSGQLSATITVPFGASTSRFPGDPGVNNMIIGTVQKDFSIDWFEKRLFPGATPADPPTKRVKAAREYNTASSFAITAAYKTKLTNHANAGRINIFSSKGIIQGGGTVSLQDILDGLVDDVIDANATFLNGLKTPTIYAFYHEPETNIMAGSTVNATNRVTADLYRRAYRRIITRMYAIAPTKLCFASPFYTSNVWAGNNGAWNDFRWFHPNWTGNPDGFGGAGSWLTNGPFTAGGSAGSWVHIDGTDLYNPTIPSGQSPSSTLKTWVEKADIINKRIATGARQLPWAIGELGVYNQVANMISGGVDAEDVLREMITIGAATTDLVATIIWNAGLAAYDDVNDVYPTATPAQRKTGGLRNAINNNPRVKML